MENEEETSFEDLPESEFLNLSIPSHIAQKNYDMAGKEVTEEENEISLATYSQLLSDEVHHYILEVLNEVRLPYKLSDFQLSHHYQKQCT